MEAEKLALVASIKTSPAVEVPLMPDPGNMPLIGLMGKYFVQKVSKGRIVTDIWAGVFTRKMEGNYYLMTYVRAFVHPTLSAVNRRAGDVATVLIDLKDVTLTFNIFETREECQAGLEEQLRRMKEKS